MNSANEVLNLVKVKIYEKMMAQMGHAEGEDGAVAFKDHSKVPAYLALSELFKEISDDEDIKRLVGEE